MAEDLTIAAEGNGSLERVRRMLQTIEGDDAIVETELRVVYGSEGGGENKSNRGAEDNADTDVGRPPRVSAGTNEHRALWLVQRYCSANDVETVTRRDLTGTDLQEQTELSDKQIGNALFGLYRKQLLERGEGSDEQKLNEYQLTQQGRGELERVGTPVLS